MTIGIYTYGTRGDVQPYIALALGLMGKGHQVVLSPPGEKQQKKSAYTYFMPPVIPTTEFPMEDFRLLNAGWYNKFTYKIARFFFWRFVKATTNEYRRELGLPVLAENILDYIDRQQPLDLYCFSPSLIPQPKDWMAHHKITGF